MGAIVEINTDGLAKLGEIICYSLGLTALGRKKMANAESYAAIKQAETDTKIRLLRLKGEEEVANYVSAKEARKMNNVKSVVEKATSHFMEGEKVSDEPVSNDWTNRFFTLLQKGISVNYFLNRSECVPVLTSSSICNSLLSVFLYINSQSGLI